MTPSQFRELRKSLDLTQVQLAEHLGLTRRAIWCYETQRSPIPKTVELAMRAVRDGGEATPPVWLIEGTPTGGAPRWTLLAKADTMAEAADYMRKLRGEAQEVEPRYIYRTRRGA